MAVSEQVRRRIKKLIALSSSPNANEAASARQEAARLMSKHGLTMADFEDDVTEMADDSADEERLRLARAVGLSRRASALVSRRGEIAFRGRPAHARAARELYKSLVAACGAHCEIGPRDPGRDLHRIAFWVGFVDAVVARLLEDEVNTWTAPARNGNGKSKKPSREPAAADVIPTQVIIQEAASDFAAYCSPQFAQRSIESVQRDGHAAGYHFGCHVHIPARDRAPATDRALGRGQENRS